MENVKAYLILLITLFSVSSVKAQEVIVLPERCNIEDVEIITGDIIPNGYAVVGLGCNYPRTEQLQSITDFTPKQLKVFRKDARKFNSCYVFVDFKGEVLDLYDKNHKNTNLSHVHSYLLRKTHTL
jgi:hypothetical protein